MKLPHPDRAIVDIAKLREYCLDPQHQAGGGKARVFRSALGLTADDAAWLRDRLLEAVFGDARLVRTDEFGARYSVDFELRTRSGSCIVRSGWIIRIIEDFPRLTTCYVLKRV